jgi:hypothetical protein
MKRSSPVASHCQTFGATTVGAYSGDLASSLDDTSKRWSSLDDRLNLGRWGLPKRCCVTAGFVNEVIAEPLITLKI